MRRADHDTHEAASAEGRDRRSGETVGGTSGITRAQALDRATRKLAEHGVDEPRLEAEILMAHALGLDKVRLYAGLRECVTPHQSSSFGALVQRRASHEPSAYITGHKEFFGLDFAVDRSVLIPRPESELLVEKALLWAATAFAGASGVKPARSSCR